jgi:hypothetical protein
VVPGIQWKERDMSEDLTTADAFSDSPDGFWAPQEVPADRAAGQPAPARDAAPRSGGERPLWTRMDRGDFDEHAVPKQDALFIACGDDPVGTQPLDGLAFGDVLPEG